MLVVVARITCFEASAGRGRGEVPYETAGEVGGLGEAAGEVAAGVGDAVTLGAGVVGLGVAVGVEAGEQAAVSNKLAVRASAVKQRKAGLLVKRFKNTFLPLSFYFLKE